MKFHLMQTGVVGRRHEIEQGMAGQRNDLYQRFLEEVRGYVRHADDLGFYGYCQPEHHLQIEGFEANNHPGMFSLFVGEHSKRLRAGIMGYTMTTHNPVRVAEEIATLDHMLQGRMYCGFTRGYHARWVDAYSIKEGIGATQPSNVKAKDEQDANNRSIFEEAVRVIKKAWNSDVFSHQGDNWQFPPEGGSDGHPAYAKFGKGQDADGLVRKIGIAPKCYQDPHPPIYGGFAASSRTIDFWAEEGGKLIVLADNLDFCENLNNRYIETAKKSGREDCTAEDASAWGGFLMLTESKSRAEELMEEHMWFWNEWFIPHGQRPPNVLVGTADEIADKIEQARDRLHFNELFLMFGQGHLEPNENHEEIENFIAKVAPRFARKDEAGIWT